MQAERGHSSIAAPQCRHMQGFQTLLCRPVLPYTRVGSFRILQRCVHDARYAFIFYKADCKLSIVCHVWYPMLYQPVLDGCSFSSAQHASST